MASLKFKFVPIENKEKLQEGLVLNKVNNQWVWDKGYYIQDDKDPTVWYPAQAACGTVDEKTKTVENPTGFMVKID